MTSFPAAKAEASRREGGLAVSFVNTAVDGELPWQDYAEKLDWQLKQVGSSLEEMQRIGVKNFPRKSPLYFRPGEPVQFRTPSRKMSSSPY